MAPERSQPTLLMRRMGHSVGGTRADIPSLGQGARSYDYDEIGNLKDKGGLVYAYPEPGATSVRPHAVTRITGSVAGQGNPAFSYDANGNLLSGLGRSYGWSSFDQANRIDKLDGAGQAVQRTGFRFGPEHQRVVQTVAPVTAGVAGAATRTIRYAGAVEKEEDAQAGTTTIRTYLPGGLGYVQEVVSGTGVAATAEGARVARYFLKDRLGSPIAIMDDSRAVLQRLSYDAWGRRRGADGSDDAGQGLGSLANTQDHSGYTGQEQLDELGLVHLNGRIYDPIVGRMVSADPTVPQPFNPEALNRYSYVYNSPLGYVDPTGYSADGVQTLPLIRVVAQNGENTSGSLQSVGVKSGFAMSVVALPGGAMFELAERKVRQYATGSRIAKVTRYATALARNKQAAALVARLVAKQALKSAVAVALTGGVGTVLVVVSTVDTAHDVWNIMAEAAAQEDAAAQAPPAVETGADTYGSPGGGCGQEHHICTNKNEKSAKNGGPWTPRFRAMFEKANMELEDAENVVQVKNHVGPHSPEYHRYVFRFLEGRTEGLSGAEYSSALRSGLKELAEQIRTPGTPLNDMITKRWKP
jgi:RHS repeat-associated protein